MDSCSTLICPLTEQITKNFEASLAILQDVQREVGGLSGNIEALKMDLQRSRETLNEVSSIVRGTGNSPSIQAVIAQLEQRIHSLETENGLTQGRRWQVNLALIVAVFSLLATLFTRHVG